jgi:hypothetical protein
MDVAIAKNIIINVIYSEKDNELKERILKELQSLDILTGVKFIEFNTNSSENRLRSLINEKSEVLFLVSENFLNSTFVTGRGLLYLLEQIDRKGRNVFSIIVRPCNWRDLPSIQERHLLPKNAEPLSDKTDLEFTNEINYIGKEIIDILGNNKVYNGSKTTPIFEKNDFELNSVNGEQLWLFKTAPSTERVIYRLNWMASKGNKPLTVSTGLLLFAMIDEGYETSDTDQTVKFLANLVQSKFEEKYKQVKDNYLVSKGIYLVTGDKEGFQSGFTYHHPERITQAVLDTFEKARELSLLTNGTDQIHERHLLASLITLMASNEKTYAQISFEGIGVSIAILQDKFLTFVKSRNDGYAHIWEKALPWQKITQTESITRLAGYHPDDAKGGEDWLDIDKDVNAFANLIASRTISPPLSIGLFGEWGSGKTFFMRHLKKRIDYLSKTAQNSGQMQRDIPYYKRIAQIEFNAWHYAESNLWASLVEHIFDNLRVAGEDNIKMILKLQEHLLSQLNLEKTTLQHTEAKAVKAKEELHSIELRLNEVRNKISTDTNTLQSIKTADIFSTIDLSDPTLKSEIDRLLSDLNINQVHKDTKSLIDALGELKSILQRSNNLLMPLIKSKDNWKRFLWLIFCLASGPIVGLLIVVVKQQINAQWLTESVSLLSGFAALLVTISAWIRSQAIWVSGWVGKAELVKQKIDTKIAERQVNMKSEITEIENDIEISKVEYESALRERENAQLRVNQAQTELEEATSEKLLAKFIQDRVASNDYRQHLGVLALVRDDFEKLSDYIENQNRRLAPTNQYEKPTIQGLEEFKTLEEEDKGKDERINRIVLYIDDLDRCPPNKVVDVLQAVHLLLAFPLFVVVVGVDARWVTRSLETRYQELLRTSTETQTEHLIGTATANDYLEKIFQIPFWLNPMNEEVCNKMVTGLIRDSNSKKPPLLNNVPPINIADLQMDKKTIVEPIKPVKTPLQESDILGQNTHYLIEDLPGTKENLLTHINLEISDSEQSFMGKLIPLLGKSPRAIKRFVNIYRLIKAGLSVQEINSFLSQDDILSDSDAVLFLLAVDNGIPSTYEKFTQYVQTVNYLKSDWLAEVPSISYSSEWLKLKQWIETNPEIWKSKPSFIRISKWIPCISRYSFRSRKA